jgi:hypothetical protein
MTTNLSNGRGWLSDAAAASIHRIDRQIGRPLDINEAGRTWEQQNQHWLTYKRYGKPIALHPDTPSIHQLGNAIDTDDRLIAIMNDHGWRQTVFRNGQLVEPWHFEYFINEDNHRNEGVADVNAGQRTAGPNGVKRRSSPSSQSAEAGDLLTPGTVGNFTGWIRGENVNGNDTWYQGTSGHWFWSGGFNEGSTAAGLKDLNPVTPPPTSIGPAQRQVKAEDVVKRRSGPSTSSAIAGDPLPAGEIGNFAGWINGEAVNGNPVWFQGTSGHWFWSGGFTDSGTHDLRDLNSAPPVVTPPPTSGSVLDPAAPWKSQTPDSALATWVGSPNYNNSATGLGAKLKTGITQHWFGTSSTLGGTDSHFQNPGGEIRNGRGTGASAQYGIGADGTIHQYVLEKDYAHTNGTYEGNATRITIEHESGPSKPATEALIQASARLHADIARRHGWTELVWMGNVDPHKKWVETQCPGDLPSGDIIARANKILNPVVEPPIVIPPLPDTIPVDRGLLQSWFDKLKNLLGK